ncbi:hypothetical protein [Nocardia gipuzkoensis]
MVTRSTPALRATSSIVAALTPTCSNSTKAASSIRVTRVPAAFSLLADQPYDPDLGPAVHEPRSASADSAVTTG